MVFAAGVVFRDFFCQAKSHFTMLSTLKFRGLRTCALSLLTIGVFAFSSGAYAADAPAGNADAAKAKVSMCIGCHGIPGYKASFPEIYSVPMIAGQNAAYIQSALRDYASGSRSHPTMDAIAGSLTAQDIADLSAYYANLK
jgi:cytochrome c553